MTDLEIYKRQAAEEALAYIDNGMTLGLGSGSTAEHLLYALAERLTDGRLRNITGVASSERTAAVATRLGIPLATLAERPVLDIAIDGADEVDPALHLIKGRGGALLREKIIAASATRFLVIVDETKLVNRLGERMPLPIELVAFALPLVERRLYELGGEPTLRRAADGNPYRTDEGHVIVDVHFGAMPDPIALGAALNTIPGIMEHGIFAGMAELAFVAGPAGVARMQRATP
ncbi:MAG TPA: ribose-5-phosphate isomerase RpiA [Roseiflexaceae bacterium]|nr:ribose-5-phosphate isomerase RpiA [Roseiflexaceae bacterium]HMP40818.1 ribose-5-phosphate isomerase RpiA [Roseiflexaceae bacterium]